MNIQNANDFEKCVEQSFGFVTNNSFFSLENKQRIILEIENTSRKKRAMASYAKALEIVRKLLDKGDYWVKVVDWNNKSATALHKVIDSNHLRFKTVKDDFTVYYYYFFEYSDTIASFLIKAMTHFELGLEPYLNIGCHFYSFNNNVAINVYDDRGMDIASSNNELLSRLKSANYPIDIINDFAKENDV